MSFGGRNVLSVEPLVEADRSIDFLHNLRRPSANLPPQDHVGGRFFLCFFPPCVMTLRTSPGTTKMLIEPAPELAGFLPFGETILWYVQIRLTRRSYTRSGVKRIVFIANWGFASC